MAGWQSYEATSGLPDVLRADALRFHPNCSVGYGGKGKHLPAMTAAIRNNHTGQLQGVHCTYLAGDGSKATMPDEGPARRIYGNARCGSVRLIHSAEICDGIGIAEGIETALAVMCMGWLPVWSVLSIPGLRTFPAMFDCITVWGDNDAEANDRVSADGSVDCHSMTWPRSAHTERLKITIPEDCEPGWAATQLRKLAHRSKNAGPISTGAD